METTRFEIKIEKIQPIFLTDEAVIEFRDPATMQGGRVSFRRQGTKILVAFEDLDPGVVPAGVTANPVEANNLAAILEHTITWLENLQRVSLPGAWDTARPLGFDGLATLKKVKQQLEQEQ